MSVATYYGKDSLQYIQAGGKPRKKLSRRSSNIQSPSERTATTLNAANNNSRETSVVLP
ncbi:MAG: hypothetical protein V7L11_10110 [Nostoc sp.]|uniref:hypothetical protein n=1 Tax=Nostoc sp. TaxID=1180 RepID=UPI002FFA3A93